MDSEDSPGLLKSILGIFAQRQPGKAPTSVKSQALDAWVRADAYLQYETNNFDEIEPEQVARTLGTLEKLVQYDSDQEPDSVSSIIVSIYVLLPCPTNTRLWNRAHAIICHTQSSKRFVAWTGVLTTMQRMPVQAQPSASASGSVRMTMLSSSFLAWTWSLRGAGLCLAKRQT